MSAPTTVKEVYNDIKDTEYGTVKQVMLIGESLDLFFRTTTEFESYLDQNPNIANHQYTIGKKTVIGKVCTMIIYI